MSNYYQLQNGEIVKGPLRLPFASNDETGTHWIGSEEEAAKYGFYPATIERPEYNPITHELVGPVVRVENGRPVERYTVSPKSFIELQYNAILRLWQECEDYISGPNKTRYHNMKLLEFKEIKDECKEWLSDHPSATQEEREPYENKISRIEAAKAWCRSVKQYGYMVQDQIRNATLENWPVLWDFSIFDASDPDVWLEELS